MIGVITYISVLERNKEIGILRAIGASKRNISSVFNAETFIIGALSGIIGIVLSELALIPINYLIHKLSNQPDLSAYLPVLTAGGLIILSIILTLIGGLIPSRSAAKSDPVAALTVFVVASGISRVLSLLRGIIPNWRSADKSLTCRNRGFGV